MSASSTSVAKQVEATAQRLPEGKAVPLRVFLACGPASAVRPALSRLVARGVLVNPARGVYARPKPNRFFGPVPPDADEVARVIAEATGDRLAPHGAEVARRLGFTTQMAVQPAFYTTGRTRRLKVGRGHVALEHAPARLIAQADSRAGLALLALHHLGPAHVTPLLLRTLHERVPLDELARLPYLPTWLRARLGRPGGEP